MNFHECARKNQSTITISTRAIMLRT